jgi:hypothetical protein
VQQAVEEIAGIPEFRISQSVAARDNVKSDSISSNLKFEFLFWPGSLSLEVEVVGTAKVIMNKTKRTKNVSLNKELGCEI